MDDKVLTMGNALFEPYVMHRGQHWILYLNTRDQRFLGRSYLWLAGRHEDNMPFDSITEDEWNDLRVLMFLYRRAVSGLWGATRINNAWLGNEVVVHRGHGHMHLVPRYENAPTFLGREFPDPNPFGNFGGHDRLGLPEHELFTIRDEIIQAFYAT